MDNIFFDIKQNDWKAVLICIMINKKYKNIVFYSDQVMILSM